MADQDKIANIQLPDHFVQIGCVVLVCVILGTRPFAIAVTAQVERTHVIVGGERRRDEIEPVRIRAAAVEADHRRSARGAVVLVVELAAARLDKTARIRSWYIFFHNQSATLTNFCTRRPDPASVV